MIDFDGLANSNGGVWSSVMDMTNLVNVQMNGSLTLLPFRPEVFRPDVHAATYKCVAANEQGKIVSTPVHVRAGSLPLFTDFLSHFFSLFFVIIVF